jgi:hypothetical protein
MHIHTCLLRATVNRPRFGCDSQARTPQLNDGIGRSDDHISCVYKYLLVPQIERQQQAVLSQPRYMHTCLLRANSSK